MQPCAVQAQFTHDGSTAYAPVVVREPQVAPHYVFQQPHLPPDTTERNDYKALLLQASRRPLSDRAVVAALAAALVSDSR